MLEAPEMLTSLILVELLGDNESLTITGCLRANLGSGYSRTWKFESSIPDIDSVVFGCKKDSFGRNMRVVEAIDAVNFS